MLDIKPRFSDRSHIQLLSQACGTLSVSYPQWVVNEWDGVLNSSC